MNKGIPSFDEQTLASLDPETLFSGEDFLSNIEADCYWCLSRLLENIQVFFSSSVFFFFFYINIHIFII